MHMGGHREFHLRNPATPHCCCTDVFPLTNTWAHPLHTSFSLGTANRSQVNPTTACTHQMSIKTEVMPPKRTCSQVARKHPLYQQEGRNKHLHSRVACASTASALCRLSWQRSLTGMGGRVSWWPLSPPSSCLWLNCSRQIKNHSDVSSMFEQILQPQRSSREELIPVPAEGQQRRALWGAQWSSAHRDVTLCGFGQQRWDTKESMSGPSLFPLTCRNKLEATELREKGNKWLEVRISSNFAFSFPIAWR